MADESGRFGRFDEYFAQNLRAYREAEEVSQEELARRMVERGYPFSQATVWKVEHLKRPVRIGEMAALTDALGLPPGRSFTQEPEAFQHAVNLGQAHHRAHAAYEALKAAARAYINAQDELALSVRMTTDAGYTVSELYRSWLSIPAEQAAIEARIEGDHEADDANRINEAVDQILEALREHGYPAVLDPADITYVGPEEPPKPPQ